MSSRSRLPEGVALLTLAALLGAGGAPRAGETGARLIGVDASSTLKAKYDVRFLFDGTPQQSWVEGAEDDGVDEKITLTFSEPVDLKTFRIQNGFGKKQHWKKNNRIRELLVYGETKSATVRLKDTLAWQTVTLDPPIRGRIIWLKILSVYRGTKWRDTAIAELELPGIPIALPAPPPEQEIPPVVGFWNSEGEGWVLEIETDGSCTSFQSNDPPDQPPPFRKTSCSWTWDGRALTLSLEEDPPRQLVLGYDAAAGHLTIDGGFAASRTPGWPYTTPKP